MRIIRVLLLTFAASGHLCAFGAKPYTAEKPDPTNCALDRSEYAMRMGASLDLEYRIETFGQRGIRNFEKPGSNAPLFIDGNNTLVVLIHGFMGSPPEMLPLAESIHKSLGTSVYIPLVPGFGAGVEIAQSYRLEDWRAAIAESLAWGEHCFARVYVVGYSVGGGLVAQHVLASNQHGVRGQVLLSPFFKGAAWQQTWTGAVAAKGFLRLLRTLFRVRKLELTSIDRLSRGNYDDLKLLMRDPDTYDQAFALRAGMNMLELTQALKAVPNRVTVNVPTAVAISDADQTISRRYALKFTSRHFTKLRNTLVLDRDEGIPHQIVASNDELNPAFGRVSEWVVQQLSAMMVAK